MKRIFVVFMVLVFPLSLLAQTHLKFDDYFIDKTMRIDYFHSGDSGEEWVTVDQVYEQGIWAGSKRNLVDNFNTGRYLVKILDSSSGRLIFSKGFDSYCTFTTDNQWYEYLFLHEFGHCFAGLGDEYYTSAVAYNEFYPKGVEPTEPNITALLDPKNLKWKELASVGIEIPTPWEKEDFDKMDSAYQKVRQEDNEKIAAMKREGFPEKEVEKVEQESERLSLEHTKKVDDYLARSRFRDKVGAFEGAGYSAIGLYRPMLDCIMFTKGKKPFCKVCEQAIVRVIKYYSE